MEGEYIESLGRDDFWARAAPWNQTGKTAVLGIEPRTCRTRRENHATRPNSQWCPCIQWNIKLLQPLLSTSWLCWVKAPCTPAGKAARTNTPAGLKHERSTGLKHERSTVCRGQETLPQKLSFLLQQQLPPLAEDTLAERLRRRPAKPMGSPRVGSNPTGVGIHCKSGAG